MSDNVVEISNIKTVLNGRTIHEDVSFNLKKSEISALIAASGGGKSVLMRETLALMTPESGSIKVLGTEVVGTDQKELVSLRNSIGVLFQNGALFSGMTVAENVAVPLVEHSSLSKNEIKEIAELKLALVGLKPESAKLYPSELSGGMKKRAALARALALEPKILFLDEPTSGLDPISAREFDQLVKTLNKSLKLSVFLITHDPESLWEIADNVICLADGHVIEQGPVEKVAQSSHPWLKEYFAKYLEQKVV